VDNSQLLEFPLNTENRALEPYVFAGYNGADKSTLIEYYGQAFDMIVNPELIAGQLNPRNPMN
jgi:predicted ABC-type ATPase